MPPGQPEKQTPSGAQATRRLARPPQIPSWFDCKLHALPSALLANQPTCIQFIMEPVRPARSKLIDYRSKLIALRKQASAAECNSKGGGGATAPHPASNNMWRRGHTLRKTPKASPVTPIDPMARSRKRRWRNRRGSGARDGGGEQEHFKPCHRPPSVPDGGANDLHGTSPALHSLAVGMTRPGRPMATP